MIYRRNRDVDIRRLERRALEGGPEGMEQFLKEMVRLGLVDPKDVELCAYLGNEPCQWLLRRKWQKRFDKAVKFGVLPGKVVSFLSFVYVLKKKQAKLILAQLLEGLIEGSVPGLMSIEEEWLHAWGTQNWPDTREEMEENIEHAKEDASEVASYLRGEIRRPPRTLIGAANSELAYVDVVNEWGGRHRTGTWPWPNGALIEILATEDSRWPYGTYFFSPPASWYEVYMRTVEPAWRGPGVKSGPILLVDVTMDVIEAHNTTDRMKFVDLARYLAERCFLPELLWSSKP